MTLMARLLPDGTETRRVWLVGCPGCDQREWTHASGETLTHSSGMEAVSGADWARRKFLSTGNASLEIYMRSTRNFYSVFMAWLWRMNLVESGTHGQAVPMSGAIVLRGYRDDDPSLYHEYIMRDGVVVVDPLKGGSQTLEMGFTFKGPRVIPYRFGYTSILTVPSREVWSPPVIHLALAEVGSTASTNALTFPPADELYEVTAENVGTVPASVALEDSMTLDYISGESVYPLWVWSVNLEFQRAVGFVPYDVLGQGGMSALGPVEPGYTMRESLLLLAGVEDESTYDGEEYVFSPYEGLTFGAQRVSLGGQMCLRFRLISSTLPTNGRFVVRYQNNGYGAAPAFKREYETRNPLQPARLLFGDAAFSVDTNVVNVD